jgi:quaternary ammonium compound-resistance protein SugE
VGAAGTAIAGMVLFGEVMNVARIACLRLVLVGIAGLKLTGGA